MYLLDTDVVSELRKLKPHQSVVAWIQAAPTESLFVSAVAVGEIQAGIELTRQQDAAKANEIERYSLKPIGVVHSTLKSRKGAPKFGNEGAPDAWIEIRSEVAEGLMGIDVGCEIARSSC